MQKDNPPIHENSFSIEFDQWTTLSSIVAKSTLPFASNLGRKYEKELAQFIFVFAMSFEGDKWK